MRITRKHLLKMGAMAGAGLALPLGTLSAPLARLATAQAVSSPAVEPFRVPLPTPPVLKPVRTDGRTDYYEITQKEDEAKILPGLRTTVWSYDGIGSGCRCAPGQPRSGCDGPFGGHYMIWGESYGKGSECCPDDGTR